VQVKSERSVNRVCVKVEMMTEVEEDTEQGVKKVM
jgi:hypothetical protein